MQLRGLAKKRAKTDVGIEAGRENKKLLKLAQECAQKISARSEKKVILVGGQKPI